MILHLGVGDLCEPLSGRRWPGPTIPGRCAARTAHYRRHGVGPGDRVLVHFGNCLEFLVDVLALWRLGACVVPIDPRLTPFEVGTLARAARPRCSVWRSEPDPGMASALRGLGVTMVSTPADGEAAAGGEADGTSALSLDGDALILFTSGTTGRPKGVVHTHRSLRARWLALAARPGLRGLRRSLCLLPTHFGHGLICNALFPWLTGQDLYIAPPFRPDLLLQLGALVDEHRITFMSSVPSMWRLALKTARPPRARTLERVFCGSAPLSASLWRDVREWSGTDEVLNAYGITEVGSWMAGTTGPEFVPEDGLVGEAWGGTIAILRSADADAPPSARQACEPGEAGYVWVNTPALMRGYLDRDDLTAAAVTDGWFTTRDVGVIDARGRLYLRGRVREEINRGGAKVYPGDVDAVLERFEHTVDVCTFGYGGPEAEEEVGVAVVLKASDDETLSRLHAWARHHLAAHQLPRRWYVLDAIPRSSSGKVNRSEMSERCARLQPLDAGRLRRGAAAELGPSGAQGSGDRDA